MVLQSMDCSFESTTSTTEESTILRPSDCEDMSTFMSSADSTGLCVNVNNTAKNMSEFNKTPAQKRRSHLDLRRSYGPLNTIGKNTTPRRNNTPHGNVTSARKSLCFDSPPKSHLDEVAMNMDFSDITDGDINSSTLYMECSDYSDINSTGLFFHVSDTTCDSTGETDTSEQSSHKDNTINTVVSEPAPMVQTSLKQFFPVRKSVHNNKQGKCSDRHISIQTATEAEITTSPTKTIKSGKSEYQYTQQQWYDLESAFTENPFCRKGRKQTLGKQVGLEPEAVLVWLREARDSMRKHLRCETHALVPFGGDSHVAVVLRGVKLLP